MDGLLIVVTVLSLVVALVMSVVAWRASTEERQRAAARVAALSAAAGMAQPPHAQPSAAADRIASRPWRAVPAPAQENASALAIGTAAPAVVLNTGFLGASAATLDAGSHQRGLAVAAAVFAVLLGAFALVRVGGGNQVANSVPASVPLELLSLRHERDGANLLVTGLVRNPPSAPPVERVSAVVLLFDPQGAFVTSATAPIDFVRLASGEESPFVVRMQAPSSVARYRVSFRTENGTVTHVDRRDGGAQSAPVALTRQ
ncbi:MAG TPA: hypothetical protein PLH72_10995 [Vicinamibacterales bacterium]|jgi:hypothetical protein|nr:hypothetical protein [Vicinamibacterales bacterium]